MPGQGSHYWTARYGQYWVGGGIYQTYAASGWECGGLGPPVKPYQWISEFAAYGMWFLGGVIYYSGGRWRIVFVDYGQTAGRLVEDAIGSQVAAPPDAEVPPDPPAQNPPKPKPAKPPADAAK